MENPSAAFRKLRQNLLGTPAWALDRIQETKEKGSVSLDLSIGTSNQHEKLLKLPNAIYDLVELTTLNLNGNQLRMIPEWITKLQNLTALDLGDNQFDSFPEPITQLQKLIILDLSGNELSKIPETITRLQNLTALYLSANRLSSLPESITQLQNLTTLYLGGNRFSNFPELIAKLQNLTTLYLSGNQLNALPESITKLQNLTIFVLTFNLLNTIPESIGRLQNLIHFDLSDNQLRTFPESITGLPKLTTLYLGGNGINRIPESITKMQNLTTLDLRDNSLSSFPESIVKLQNLVNLNLSGNELKAIPASITKLKGLTNLNLSANQISTLPESITRLPNLTTLHLGRNPLVSPPIEVSTQGFEAIRQYFRQLNQEGVDHLYEAKLLILGEGGAGKTTLANKIKDSNYQLRDEETTRGVDVVEWQFHFINKPIVSIQRTSEKQVSNWEFQDDSGEMFRVNIWDFGGQEIYHATHQFFLTKRSLYLLVADSRREDTDFYYWLNIAELLSDGSPLLIIKNEKQNRHREINERQLKGEFSNLKEVLATNLATNRGLDAVRQEIEHQIQKLPHIGTPLPRTWVRVREGLEKDSRNYISLGEYLAICKENGFAEPNDSLQLSGYLHDIGVFLHFQDDPLLKRIVILKPKWGTDAVYKVLENKTVIQNLGRFTRSDLDKIWAISQFQTVSDELLQLMMKFKLCYEIPPNTRTYIAPQLLTESQPEYEWDEKDNLLLRYSYEFMPKGIMTQFIVVMHPYIQEQSVVWKSGVVIEKDNTRAEVIEYYGKREIHVRVAGPQERDLLTIIRHELKQIHDTYKRLKYDELIRCNCSACKDSQEPHFYAIAKLLEFRADRQLEIQCQRKPYEMVNVMKLLGDMIDLSKSPEKDSVQEFNIENFYASGDNRMTKMTQTIKDSTVHGSVVAAERIKDSFNAIQKADIKDGLKEQLKQLTQAVEAMAKELPKDKAEEVANDMKQLADEATQEKPNPKEWSVSIDGLIKAAHNLGKVGDAVIELAVKVRKILTGGLI